ncbi:MAG: hypothetical protein K6A96_04390 [Prevotella sp.]|nr:hypothetical protein [Prevotella sp.]
MTTVELRSSIMAELDQMSVEMLESVSHYVKRLRRHARRTTGNPTSTAAAPTAEGEVFTPRVMRFKRGNPWYATDEEVNRLLHEYLTEKYK